MRKFLPILVVGILVLSGLGAVAINIEKESNAKQIDNENIGDPKDYTHTVFVEVSTGQFCGPCHSWNANIYNTYNSGQYDFEFVMMIAWDHGGNTLNTKANIWRNLYGVTSIPTSIFDGDYRRIVGNYPNQLPGALDACGARSVKDLEASMTVTWLGDAEIQVDIEIENNEATTYNGYIRVPITEITSRYTTAGGQRYHYGFLDYAFPMNTDISIPSGGTYTNSVTWDGDEHQDNHGDDFGDITPENIKVFMGIFNDNNDYVDETVAILVEENQPPGKTTVSGPIVVDPDVEYEYSFEATDPDGDDVRYYIDWGDITEGWIGPSPSGEPFYVNHSWSENGTYEVKAKARDENYLEGPWSDPLTVIVGNLAPEKPEIVGNTKGKAGNEYEYTFVSTDPNGDQLSYYIKWGDGTITDWTTPQASGVGYSEVHTWDVEDQYRIEAKAKDTDGAESDWAELVVVMPRSRAINTPFFKFLQNYQNLFQILRLLLQLY